MNVVRWFGVYIKEWWPALLIQYLLAAGIAIFIVMTVYLWPLFETYRQITVAGGGWVTP